MTEPAFQPPADWRGLGEVTDYESLLNTLRARAVERQIAVSGDANEVAGLPTGYIQKLIGPRPVRRIGMMSLGPLLAVLGAKLIAVENPEAIARFGGRIRKRDERLVRSGNRGGTTVFLSRRFMRKIQADGRKARWAKTSPEQRSELARNLSRIRWSKAKRKKRAKARWLVKARAKRGSSTKPNKGRGGRMDKAIRATLPRAVIGLLRGRLSRGMPVLREPYSGVQSREREFLKCLIALVLLGPASVTQQKAQLSVQMLGRGCSALLFCTGSYVFGGTS